MYKIAVFSKIKSDINTIKYFKELPFYNKPIEKPKIKRLKSIDQIAEITFYEQLSVIKQIKRLEDMQCRSTLK